MRIYKNLIFFFTLLLLINDAHSQGTANLFLQKADKAYRSMQYANAAIYYEKYLSEPKKTENTSRVNAVLLAIADSYWNMRDFNHASFWYKRLPSSITNLSTLVRYRTAELLAKEEKYEEAANMLSTLPDFKLRAKGFLETDEMKTDSADWKIKYLDLNTPYYKEFSPLILKNMFLWTTNEPQKI